MKSPGRSPGQTLKREARRRTLSRLRSRNAILFAVVLTAALVGITFVWRYVSSIIGAPPGPLLFGYVLGVGTSCVPWILWVAVTSVDGSWSWRLGAQGEEWTADQLGKLSPPWDLVHNIPFDEGTGPWAYQVDVDHVAVGPGGVWVIESKFRGGYVDLGAKKLSAQVLNDVRQAKENAGRVSALLRRYCPNARVRPLLVYWGPEVVASAGVARTTDSVALVSGKDGETWLSLFDGDVVGPDEQAVALRRLRDQVGRIARREQDSEANQLLASRLRRRSEQFWHYSIALTVGVAVLIMLGEAWPRLGRPVVAIARIGGGLGALTLMLLPLFAAALSVGYAVRLRSQSAPYAVRGPGAALFLWAAGLVTLLAVS